jgi:hippurate hydrolase
LQEISARELPAATPAILTVGTVQSEGADNAIADSAILKGTLRSFDEKVRKMVKKRVEQISKNIAKAFRATAETTYNGGCPTLINDEKVSFFVEEILKKTLGADRVFSSNDLGGDVRANSGGSEDFAYISHKIPSVMVALGAGQQDKGYPYPLHHPKAAFDEGVLWIGSAIFTLIGCKYLS